MTTPSDQIPPKLKYNFKPHKFGPKSASVPSFTPSSTPSVSANPGPLAPQESSVGANQGSFGSNGVSREDITPPFVAHPSSYGHNSMMSSVGANPSS